MFVPHYQEVFMSLHESLDALNEDKVIVDSLGDEFVRCFTAVKKHEIRLYEENKEDSNWEKKVLFSTFVAKQCNCMGAYAHTDSNINAHALIVWILIVGHYNYICMHHVCSAYRRHHPCTKHVRRAGQL